MAPPRKKAAPKAPTPVEAIGHADTRANIPTGELSYMVDPDEQAPAKVRYPRDPSLDPQLVWRGKDEQDAADLVVPAVPVYIPTRCGPPTATTCARGSSSSGCRT